MGCGSGVNGSGRIERGDAVHQRVGATPLRPPGDRPGSFQAHRLRARRLPGGAVRPRAPGNPGAARADRHGERREARSSSSWAPTVGVDDTEREHQRARSRCLPGRVARLKRRPHRRWRGSPPKLRGARRVQPHPLLGDRCRQQRQLRGAEPSTKCAPPTTAPRSRAPVTTGPVLGKGTGRTQLDYRGVACPRTAPPRCGPVRGGQARDQSMSDAKAQLASAIANPDRWGLQNQDGLARRAGVRTPWCHCPATASSETPMRWGKQNLAERLTQIRVQPPDPLDPPGHAVPGPRSGRWPRQVVRRRIPRLPWIFATDGEYSTAFPAVARGPVSRRRYPRTISPRCGEISDTSSTTVRGSAGARDRV